MLYLTLCALTFSSNLEIKTNDLELNRISHALVEYKLPPAYVNNNCAHDPFYNISAVAGEPFGNGNMEYPWRDSLGVAHCPNVSVRFFRYFPAGKSVTVDTSRATWTFPNGTVFAEAFMQKHDGKEYPWLLLTRTKRNGYWSDFRALAPVPSREELEAEVGKWKVRYLKIDMRNHHSATVVESSNKKVEVLPDLEDDVVVRLLSRPFREIPGYWGDSFLPTSAKDFNLVPKDFTGGAVDLGDNSCMQCHETAGKHVDRFEPSRDWYGHIKGSDGIFSWHPFEASCISSNGFNVTPVYRESEPLKFVGSRSVGDYQ